VHGGRERVLLLGKSDGGSMAHGDGLARERLMIFCLWRRQHVIVAYVCAMIMPRVMFWLDNFLSGGLPHGCL